MDNYLSHFKKNMASRLSGRDDGVKGSECVFDLYCQPCSEENKHLEAEGYCMDCKEYLCKDCYANHRKPRPTRHHVLLQTDKLPQQIPISTPKTAKDPCTIPCHKHPNEMIKFHCNNHDIVVCNVCITLTHASCNMNYIPDITHDDKHGRTLKGVTSKLNGITETLATINGRAQNNLEKIQDIYNDAIDAVKKLRADINEMIDELELRVTAEADLLKETDTKNMQSIAEKSSRIRLELNAFREQLDRLQKSNQENNLFVKSHVMRGKLRELQKQLKTLNEENEITNYTFERSEEVWDFVNTTNSYGHLSKRQAELRDSEILIAEHLKDVSLTVGKDKKTYSITGITLLPGQLLVLVDKDNETLKVFDIDSYSIKCTFVLPKSAWDVTKTGRQTVAVTTSKRARLLCFRIGQNIVAENEIALSSYCIGVSFSKARFFVTFIDTLEILNQDGYVLQRILSDSENMFYCPNYVITNDNDILVSDSTTNKVLIFSSDGHFKAEYKSETLKSSLGMVANGRGSLLVCGCESNNIHVVSEKGCFKQILLSAQDGLKGPQSLAFSEKSGLLFVTQEYDMRLRIYQIRHE